MINISVITPVYNAEKFLKKSVKSVLEQDLPNVEVICIDDGSSDQSLSLLRELQQSDKRLIVLTQSNSGSGLARNAALKKARGEFIMFMDADDWYPSKDVLSTLYHKAKEYNQNIAGGSFVRYYENGRVESEFSGIYAAYKFEKEEIVPFDDYQFDYGYHRFIYNREMLIKNNIIFPDYRRFQDPIFFLKAMLASRSFVSVDKAVYAYRKGHQTVNWDIPKIKGLLVGLLENLILSKRNNLERLHFIMIDRVENDFFKIIKNNIDNDMIYYILKRFIYSIDVELIKVHRVDFELENLKIFKLIDQEDKKENI